MAVLINHGQLNNKFICCLPSSLFTFDFWGLWSHPSTRIPTVRHLIYSSRSKMINMPPKSNQKECSTQAFPYVFWVVLGKSWSEEVIDENKSKQVNREKPLLWTWRSGKVGKSVSLTNIKNYFWSPAAETSQVLLCKVRDSEIRSSWS